MSNLPGLFSSFDNLDSISVDSLAIFLKSVSVNLSTIQLENYLANKILYPQTLPLTEIDMKIDLGILREVLRIYGPKFSDKSSKLLLGDNPFINITLRKIIIPRRFLHFIPDLVSLSWAFVDGLLLDRKKEDWFEDLWTVVLSDDNEEIVGSVILPQFNGENDSVELFLLGKNFKIKAGGLTLVRCPKDRCEIAYRITNGMLLGKKENALEISGGKLGVLVDGRIR